MKLHWIRPTKQLVLFLCSVVREIYLILSPGGEFKIIHLFNQEWPRCCQYDVDVSGSAVFLFDEKNQNPCEFRHLFIIDGQSRETFPIENTFSYSAYDANAQLLRKHLYSTHSLCLYFLASQNGEWAQRRITGIDWNHSDLTMLLLCLIDWFFSLRRRCCSYQSLAFSLICLRCLDHWSVELLWNMWIPLSQYVNALPTQSHIVIIYIYSPDERTIQIFCCEQQAIDTILWLYAHSIWRTVRVYPFMLFAQNRIKRIKCMWLIQIPRTR